MEQSTKDNVVILIRSILMIASSYILGKNLFGTTINESLWQEIVSSIIAVVTLVWGFVDKTLTIESFQTLIRGLIVFAGGLLVAKGVITDSTVNALISLFIAVAPGIYGLLSTSKSKKLATGQITIEQLKK